MSSNYMFTARLVTFLTTLLLTLIVLSLSADAVSMVIVEGTYTRWSSFALATSLLTLLSVGPMFLVDWYRRGSFLSYIIVEVSWLSVLWVFWLSSGALTAWTEQQVIALTPEEASCDFRRLFLGEYYDRVTRMCYEGKVIIASSFLTWLLLMSYTVMLLVLALRAQSKGHNVWTTGVRDGALFYPNEKFVGGTPQAMAPQPAVYQSYLPSAQQPVPMSVPMSVPQTYPQV